MTAVRARRLAQGLARLDAVLRQDRAVDVGWRELLSSMAIAGAVHGAVLGGHAGRAVQIVTSAVKLPLLLIVSTALCLPSFVVLHWIAGLRDDLRPALRAVLGAQSVFAIVLVSLSPVVLFAYASDVGYAGATLVNGAAFALATMAARLAMLRSYEELEQRSPKHRVMRWVWTGLFVFVSIQAAWVLRPFLGSPQMPVQFFREGAWSNAYVEATRAMMQALGL